MDDKDPAKVTSASRSAYLQLHSLLVRRRLVLQLMSSSLAKAGDSQDRVARVRSNALRPKFSENKKITSVKPNLVKHVIKRAGLSVLTA